MTVDFTHFKLSKEIPGNADDFLVTEHWDDGCNVPLEVNGSYLRVHKSRNVLYFLEVAHQSCEMVTSFAETFQNDFLYGNRHDLEKVFGFLDRQLPEAELLIQAQTLKGNFIDTFEYGQSLVMISW